MLYALFDKKLESGTVIYAEKETAEKLRNDYREVRPFPNDLEKRLERIRPPAPTVHEYLAAFENYKNNCGQGVESSY